MNQNSDRPLHSEESEEEKKTAAPENGAADISVSTGEKKCRRFLLHDVLIIVSMCCSVAAMGAFFLPFVCVSLYPSFPSDSSFTLSAFQIASGFSLSGVAVQYSACSVLLLLPLAATVLTAVTFRMKYGIPYIICMMFDGLCVMLLLFARQLLEVLVSGYRAYLYFSVGWYAMLFAAAAAVLIALVCLFSAAVQEAKKR